MFGDLGKIMKIVGQMKAKMPEVREKLANSQYTAEAGGGVVRATVNGKMELVDLKISSEALADPELSADVEMLEDLIKAAIATAQQKAANAADEAMKELTGGMDISGLDSMLGI